MPVQPLVRGNSMKGIIPLPLILILVKLYSHPLIRDTGHRAHSYLLNSQLSQPKEELLVSHRRRGDRQVIPLRKEKGLLV